jgi:hypothetical protein
MDDYVYVVVQSHPGEGEADFSARLSRFWTHMLRDLPDEFERVYAETTKFARSDGRLSRTYLAELDVADRLEAEFAEAGIDHEPIDRDDLYPKYEAAPPDWMQIEH